MSKKEPVRKLTLDEYDDLTEENQKLGARAERAAIIAHLADVRAQIRGIAGLTSKDPLVSSLKDLEDGVDASIKAIGALPELYDRGSCSHCGAF